MRNGRKIDAEWSQDRCGMVVGLMRMIAVVHPTIPRATSLRYAARLCTIIDCAMYTVSSDPQTFFVHGHPPRDYFMNLVIFCRSFVINTYKIGVRRSLHNQTCSQSMPCIQSQHTNASLSLSFFIALSPITAVPNSCVQRAINSVQTAAAIYKSSEQNQPPPDPVSASTSWCSGWRQTP